MFENLRLLELASVLAGPSVGQFFAELGAEVIKVENIKAGGDVTRSWKLSTEDKATDTPAYFSAVNWGKKSVGLDLSSPPDRDRLYQLIQDTDVVIASFKPGDAEKLGVSDAQVRGIKPDIIYGQITGYGSDNDRVGYDAIIQAESGFMDLNGERGGEPLKMPVALIDVLAGHQLKEALLLALLRKEKTGQGAFVEVSLMQAAISSLVNQGTNWLVAHTLPKRQGSLHPNIAPYGELFQTKDGKRVIVAIGSDRQFADVCDILGLSHLSSDARFATNHQRVINRTLLFNEMAMRISAFDSERLMREIHQKKIPAGIVQNLEEVFQMKEAKEALLTGEHIMGVRNFVATGTFLDNKKSLTPPPSLGQHTQEVLERLS